MDDIPIIVSSEQASTDAKGGLFRRGDGTAIKPFSKEQLRAELQKLQANLAAALEGIAPIGNYGLEKMEVGVEVTAEGGLALIGTAKIGTRAAIKLVFERKS